MKTLEEGLKVFNHTQFRPPQREVAENFLQGKDCFVLLPTGAGKSLCYQLPAILLPGITLVVSPLLALIDNQVQYLKKLKIEAHSLNSSITEAERTLINEDLSSMEPKCKLLFVTPELLAQQYFIKKLINLQKRNLFSGLIVDEAHCITEWGHDFRKDYLKLGSIRMLFPSIPIMALTATANLKVKSEIVKILKLKNPKIFSSTFNRKNLTYEVIYKDLLKDSLGNLTSFLQERKKESGIIYCHKRSDCDILTTHLKKCGLTVSAYHAGFTNSIRETIQKDWMSGKIQIIIATISFGMGIDNPNVRFVVHWSMPSSIEGYYQESGRAGRDQQPAICRLYYSREDRNTKTFFLKQGGNKEGPVKSFDSMVDYCEKEGCRRQLILRYFEGPTASIDCGKTCDYCISPENVKKQLAMFEKKNSFSSTGYHKKVDDEDEEDSSRIPEDISDDEEKESKRGRVHYPLKRKAEEFDARAHFFGTKKKSLGATRRAYPSK